LDEFSCLSFVSNPAHERDADSSQDIIDTSDEILQGVKPNINLENLVLIVPTDSSSLRISICCSKSMLIVFGNFSITEALEGST